MTCNPLIAEDHYGWHAWCKSHNPPWIGPDRTNQHYARIDKARHLGIEAVEDDPPWVRGPGAA